MAATRPVLSWIHIGDIHATDPDQDNIRDLRALVDLVNARFADRAAFVYVPGDIADQGTAAQYGTVRAETDRLALPLHAVPGDHDFHQGTLEAFHGPFGAGPLPRAETVDGHRCLFLDVVSAGTGGPDFRLDTTQLDWLEGELHAADDAGQTAVLFMHAYPDDLRHGGDRLLALLRTHRVAAVDMGHTHYNELANDGRTVFMATRSTGQIEEGPVGLSVAAVDGGVVSWRFVELDDTRPTVLITSPADHRLVTDPASPDQVLRDTITVRAMIWSDAAVGRAEAWIDDGARFPLVPDGAEAGLWRGSQSMGALADGLHELTVEATDASGATGQERITIVIDRPGGYTVPTRHGDGSDRDSVGAWPEKGLLGTQLGPNRNGRKW